MNIREQLSVLLHHRVECVVVGGQAGVLRQAIEFSHDLDILVRATSENAERVRGAVRTITHHDPDVLLLLGRDFQQYVDEATGTEIDIHLKLIAIPDYAAGLRNASDVDFLGLRVPVLELPALYAAKRTDRPRDALHRRAIEDRLRRLVLDGKIDVDEIVLALCFDADVGRLPVVATMISELARSTAQPLLQVRLLAYSDLRREVAENPLLHETARALVALDELSRAKVLGHPARLSALLARVPLVLPEAGYRVRAAAV
jgi:hypothetical protein